MSAVTDILTSVINLKRNTSFLVDEVAVAASVAVDRQPPKSCRLEVEIVGNTVSTGLVNVAGNVNETFNFSANGVEVGEQNFTSLSGITISGISDGFIKVRCLSKMGQPINQEILVSENMSIRFFAEKGHIRMMRQGQEDVSNYRFIAEPDADVQDNDRIYAVSGIFGLTLGEIKFSEKLYDFNGTAHHIEAEIMKL